MSFIPTPKYLWQKKISHIRSISLKKGYKISFQNDLTFSKISKIKSKTGLVFGLLSIIIRPIKNAAPAIVISHLSGRPSTCKNIIYTKAYLAKCCPINRSLGMWSFSTCIRKHCAYGLVRSISRKVHSKYLHLIEAWWLNIVKRPVQRRRWKYATDPHSIDNRSRV